MEFTPIGYIKGKQSSQTTNNILPKKLDLNVSKNIIDGHANVPSIQEKDESENQNGEEEEEEDDDLGPMKKRARYSINNSMRLFNDASQFDDTIPEINHTSHNNNNINGTTNRILPNILPTEFEKDHNDIISNNNISNPIKQQQERIEGYIKTISILKLKNDALINILKQDDPNKLDSNLELIDNLSKEKDKNNVLQRDNRSLQLEINNLKEQLNDVSKEIDKNKYNDKNIQNIHEDCEREQNKLKSLLEKNKSEIENMNRKIKSLETELKDTHKKNATTTAHENQKNIEIIEINKINEQKLNDLENELSKLTELEDQHLKEIKSLNEKLKKSQELLKNQEVSFNDKIQHLQNDKNTLKEQLDSEINKYESKIKALQDDIRTFQNNINDQNDLINKQNLDTQKISQYERDLKDKINELEDLQIILNNKTKNLKDLEDKYKELTENNKQLNSKFDYEIQKRDNSINKMTNNLNKLKNDYELELKNKDELNNVIHSLKQEIMYLKETLSTNQHEIDNLNEKETNYHLTKESLENELDNLKKKLQEKDSQLNDVQYELNKLQTTNEKESKLIESKNKEILSIKGQLQEVQDQLSKKVTIITDKEREITRLIRQTNNFEETRDHLNDQITSKNEEIVKLNSKIKNLENQIFQMTIKKSDETLNIINTKNSEIQSLKTELNKLNDELDKTLKTHNLMETKILQKNETRVQDLQNEIKLLNDMIKNKSIEYNQSVEKLNDEINDWRQRYDSLNDVLQRQLSDTTTAANARTISPSNIGSILTDKENRLKNEIDELHKDKVELLKTIDKLESNLNKLITENDKLKATNAELKESHSRLSDGFAKLLNKYKERKVDYSNKLIDLENENIRLERIYERERLNNLSRDTEKSYSTLDDGLTQNRESNIQESKIDYYRLKYHREVLRNNDQKIINEYLKNVLNATIQQMQIDSNRIKQELLTNNLQPSELRSFSSLFSRYPLYDDKPSRFYKDEYQLILRDRFRKRIFQIICCLRLKQVMELNNRYNKRLQYLERKIKNFYDSKNDRFSW